MAWYYGTYSCGHEGRTNIIGPTKNRQWIADRHFEKMCPECWEKHLQEEREKENAKAAEMAKEMELPELQGSEKQVAWANTLRQKMIDEVTKRIELFESQYKDDNRLTKALDDVNQVMNYILVSKTKADWYINNRYYALEHVFEKAKKEMEKKEVEEAPETKKIEAEVNAEITVRPEEAKTETVAEIKFGEDWIEVHFPEKRDDFWKLIKKKMGYYWSRDKRVWRKEVVTRNGSSSDRAGETGHTLLANGFIVRIADAETREKAISGQYEKEHTKWILGRLKGNYEGWLVITWDRDKEEYYNQARRITRSKYDKPSVVVPPEMFEEVLDFAETHDFKISKRAHEIIDRAKRAKEEALVVKVEKREEEKEVVEKGMPKLNVPEKVEINEELRDDD